MSSNVYYDRVKEAEAYVQRRLDYISFVLSSKGTKPTRAADLMTDQEKWEKVLAILQGKSERL